MFGIYTISHQLGELVSRWTISTHHPRIDLPITPVHQQRGSTCRLIHNGSPAVQQ